MAAHISLSPVATGSGSDWREFIAELKGPRRIDWAQSQRRRGIRREVISLAAGDPELAVVYTESADHQRSAAVLAESEEPFDVWYRSRLEELLGPELESELLFDSAPKPGPWRGWR